MENRHTRDDLKYLQAMSLEMKIQKSIAKIIEWHNRHDGNVYVSFSGGKDSTVLLHLVRSIFPDVPAAFAHTGLEYPEIVEHALSFDNVMVLRPKLNFRQVIEKYGYPVVSKDVAGTIDYCRRGSPWAIQRMEGIREDGSPYPFRERFYSKWRYLLDAPFKIGSGCCGIMKESPLDKYAKETGRKCFVGTLAAESRRREQGWLKVGCNAFDGKRPRSAPLSFWLEDDILRYIKEFDISIAKCYGEVENSNGKWQTTGVDRTGCIWCLFGCHLDKPPNKIQQLAKTHPKLYEYCLRDWESGGLGLARVMDFVGIEHAPIEE